MKLLLLIPIIFWLILSCRNPSQNKKNAVKFYNERNYEKALFEINRAIDSEPDSINYYLLRLDIYRKLELSKERLEDLNRIIRLSAKTDRISLLAHYERALLQSQQGFINEAMSDIDFFIANRDTVGCLADAYITKASILYMLKDSANSIKYYELASKANITRDSLIESDIYLGMSTVTESYLKELSLLEKAIELNDRNISAFTNLGLIYSKSGDLEQAHKFYNKAFSINPNDAIVNEHLGNFYAYYSVNVDSAIYYYQKSIKNSFVQANNAQIYMNLAVMEHRSGKLDNALLNFQHSEQLNSQNDLLQYNYALLMTDLGRSEDALLKISKAININATNPDYYNSKGSILIDLKRYNEAAIEYNNALELNPDMGSVYYNLGYLYGKQNNNVLSIKNYDKAVLLNFDLKATLVNRALQKIKISKITDACSDFDKAYKLGRTDIIPYIDKYCK